MLFKLCDTSRSKTLRSLLEATSFAFLVCARGQQDAATAVTLARTRSAQEKGAHAGLGNEGCG
jgi:hypothetical protein